MVRGHLRFSLQEPGTYFTTETRRGAQPSTATRRYRSVWLSSECHDPDLLEIDSEWKNGKRRLTLAVPV